MPAAAAGGVSPAVTVFVMLANGGDNRPSVNSIRDPNAWG